MRELIYKEMEQADAHHNYAYEKGKKIRKQDDGLVFDYIGVNDDNLHSTEHEDIASANGGGVYIKTDEHTCDGGYPVVNGRQYKVRDASKTWVKLSEDSNEKYHTKAQSKKGGTEIIVPHNDKNKMSDLELLRQIYAELKEAK